MYCRQYSFDRSRVSQALISIWHRFSYILVYTCIMVNESSLFVGWSGWCGGWLVQRVPSAVDTVCSHPILASYFSDIHVLQAQGVCCTISLAKRLALLHYLAYFHGIFNTACCLLTFCTVYILIVYVRIAIV